LLQRNTPFPQASFGAISWAFSVHFLSNFFTVATSESGYFANNSEGAKKIQKAIALSKSTH
jgi:hypothetical protein